MTRLPRRRLPPRRSRAENPSHPRGEGRDRRAGLGPALETRPHVRGRTASIGDVV